LVSQLAFDFIPYKVRAIINIEVIPCMVKAIPSMVIPCMVARHQNSIGLNMVRVNPYMAKANPSTLSPEEDNILIITKVANT
jgi:hypothetical protein